MTDFALSRPLDIGEGLTQSEVEDVFQTNFGYQFKGITLRAPDAGRYLILLANEGEIYDDDLGQGDDFTYLGEGVREKGNQKETAANTALIDAIQDPIPIYLFTSQEGIDEYEYRGLVEVQDYSYVSDGERMVYQFEIQRLGISSWEAYQEAEEELEERTETTPELTEDTTEYTTQEPKVRSSVFARKVKQNYDYTCAACGARRFSPEGQPEVEAAHIYPKSEDGADDPRNGIALCKLHHWAFDCGWFSVDDDLQIVVKEGVDQTIPDEIADLSQDGLRVPSANKIQPHPLFLEEHRKRHGFE
ncbi:HNH endonuclease [Halobellus sp. H-GB7]|uniref:HNH endonuclease n=1 Tax=Halobellus sp. H-GB7 TaxID=3069756 RepID=UPI0027B2C7A9|nr:HNH endonuclease [Halobellus sp. H-GB7]MDQ2056327.1 HNH endonuclease [Halobellus sp. H-GB7]